VVSAAAAPSVQAVMNGFYRLQEREMVLHLLAKVVLFIFCKETPCLNIIARILDIIHRPGFWLKHNV
jgi:hypothetical protein